MSEQYECVECGKTIGVEECDRNLIADWAYCDACMADLMATYERYARWDWLRRPLQMVWGKIEFSIFRCWRSQPADF